MVTTDSDTKSPGDVESSSQSKQQHSKNQPFQSSVYSLTLDEFQNSVCEGGKNFGSVNMDEFLNSIWTAEENQAQSQTQMTMNAANAVQFPHCETNLSAYKGMAKQSSLPRQGSLSVPEPLCRKTVDEVWSEIHRSGDGRSHAQNPNPAQRERTFGEMTLEDFLVRAGIVQEQDHHSAPCQQPPSYGMYQNCNHPEMVHDFVARPVVGTYQPLPQSGVGDVSSYSSGAKRGSNGYTQQPSAGNFVGRMGNGCGVGYGQGQAGIGIGSPVSPVSSDGLCTNQVDSTGNQYGMDGVSGGQKRIVDGPVERVVERRQRRMIKNRESAARSRARKQAYTVELEAELNQLKEENEVLKQALADLERKRKQQREPCEFRCEEAKVLKMQSKAPKAKEKLRTWRRSFSCPY
ncbi:protein ABSCISIC ACID-INSENSITIVE 5 [Primulina huaijiensis]|uniref:protein ABSCISIC ACID-INSENSITIVE 5 n=1 Tax=Primulina huaijiensis TaxID=1492673 RepID=UPI003CC6E9F4